MIIKYTIWQYKTQETIFFKHFNGLFNNDMFRGNLYPSSRYFKVFKRAFTELIFISFFDSITKGWITYYYMEVFFPKS